MSEPVVFVSYSHDSPEHKAWVLRLATDLRARGLNAILDVWDLVPGQDVAAFMQRGIANATRVLMVCSEPYVRKSEAGLGGVGYERLIVTAEVVQSIETKKFVPLMRSNAACSVPRFLGPRMYVDFNDDGMYAQRLEELLRELLGVPMHPRTPNGLKGISSRDLALDGFEVLDGRGAA